MRAIRFANPDLHLVVGYKEEAADGDDSEARED
jgi:hypothetical protein